MRESANTASVNCRRRGVTAPLLTTLCSLALALCALAPAAQADFSFCPDGSGAGQCNSKGTQSGIDVDAETERVYVTDWYNNRVNVFKADGEFLLAFGWGVDTGASKLETCTTASGCEAGIAGTVGAGQMWAPRKVAVDNSGGPGQGDVYVTDFSYRVQKFDSEGKLLATVGGAKGSGECQLDFRRDAIDVGSGGVLYVADSPDLSQGEKAAPTRLQRFSPAGACLGEVTLFEGDLQATDLAVDSAGNAYVAVTGTGGGGGVRKYDPSGTLLQTLAGGTVVAAPALDGAGNLYLGGLTGAFDSITITKFDPVGNVLRRYGFDSLESGVSGIAPFETALGDVLVTQNSSGAQLQVRYLTEPPPGPLVASLEASPVGNVKATLKAEIDPEGKTTEYRFDYVDEASFETEGGFASPNTKSTPLTALPGEADFNLHLASAGVGCADPVAEVGEGKCLTPETTYRFRVVFSNADGEGNSPREGSFETKPPLEIEETYATQVGTDSARLNARVNPLGIPTTGYFEYVDDATYQESGFADATEVPDVGGGQSPLSFGASEAGATRSVSLTLEPGTIYHYRVLVTDPLIAEPIAGPERTLTTISPQGAEACPENEAFRSGLSALLPDCRAYEMVTPLDKEGAHVIALAEPAGGLPAVLNQSSTVGDSLAYGTYRAFGDAPSAPYTSQYVASRDPEEGWHSHGILGQRTTANAYIASTLDTELNMLSPDLCQAWVRTVAEPPLAPGAVEGFTNLYRRTDAECGGESWEALTTVEPAHEGGSLELQGVSADGAASIYAMRDNLPGTEAPDLSGNSVERLQLYYQEAGGDGPHFVCILPSGAPNPTPCTAGTGVIRAENGGGREISAHNAIFADAGGVFWTAASKRPAPIYLRRNPEQPESAHLYGIASGKGDLIGPAFGVGNLIKSSTTVNGVLVASGGFAVGQAISGEGIAAGTKIDECIPSCEAPTKLKLSKAATASKTGAELSGEASATVSNLLTETGAFAVGQEISGAGIPAGTTIEAVGAETLTLSAEATKSKAAAALAGTSECLEAQVKACTISVSGEAEGLSGATGSFFWGAADDGSKALFTAVKGSADGDLYEFDVATETTELIAHKVLGVMGASEDATRIYLASTEVLSGANPQGKAPLAGQPNLYLYEEGTFDFITTLVAEDLHSVFSPIAADPSDRTSRVSPDGLHAAFMSAGQPTGFDNTDVNSPVACGKPQGRCDAEVYLYDATANGGEGKLLCASCNPSGARPAGENIEYKGGEYWAAAHIPVWSNIFYAPRVLSEDGSRLYFNSSDALSPLDSNGAGDVYQWEAPGSGGCDEGDLDYFPANGGCIRLISSGQSARESEFVDASASGEDVFFTTLASFVPKDYGLLDIYDARVGGGLPEPPPPAPQCEGEACQGTPEAPNDPTPASSSFEGAGNVKEEPKPRCARGKVRRKGKCVSKHRKKASKRAKHKRRGAR